MEKKNHSDKCYNQDLTENIEYLPQIFEKLSNENLLKFPKAVIKKIIFE